MLFRAIDLFTTDPALAVITVATLCVALIIAITVHEFSHAYLATSLGDRTASGQGRLTLNPIRHLDPIGSALILFAGFGWGKPVPVNPYFMRIDPRRGMALVALAGPVSNVVAATLFGILLRVGIAEVAGRDSDVFGFRGADLVEYALAQLVLWNLVLAVFNLLPISPLDGFNVALGALPREAANAFARTERYGPIILIGIILVGIVAPQARIFGFFISPVVNLLGLLILGERLM